MHIVLVNTNAVISKLLLLCTSDTTTTLQEVSTVEAIGNESCDMIVIDESLYTKQMLDVLGAFTDTQKVLLSYQGDAVEGFDKTIKKPFLPLQILSIIEEIQGNQEKNIEEEVFDVKIPPNILNFQEIEQIKILLEVDNTLLADAYLRDESLEIDKMKSVTEQLMAEGISQAKERIEKKKIEQAIEVAIQGLSKKKLKKLREGKEIKMRIQLKDNELC